MPSADFCILKETVASFSAVPLNLSDPLCITAGCFLENKVNVPLQTQISPNKNIFFPQTTAAFTYLLNHEDIDIMCYLVPESGLLCSFCSSAPDFAYPASFPQHLTVMQLLWANG